jgi:flavin-dependent dehydrogenase
MDELLLRNAEKTGARLFEGWTAESIEHRDDHTLVGLRRGESRQTVLARRVCGAWGRWGRFDRMLGRSFTLRDADRNFGFKRHYVPRDHEVAPPPDTIDLYSFRRGYLGVNWVEGNETNICGLAHETRLSGHKGGWTAFVDALRSERESLDRLYAAHEPAQTDFLSSEPVVFTPRSALENRLLLVGDAAGIIDPLAGNGMAMAIQSAALAAPLLIRSLRGLVDRAAMERSWIEEHDSLFSKRIRWSRRVASLLCRPHLLDAAMSVRTPTFIGRALLERTRATPSQISGLLRLNREALAAAQREPSSA